MVTVNDIEKSLKDLRQKVDKSIIDTLAVKTSLCSLIDRTPLNEYEGELNQHKSHLDLIDINLSGITSIPKDINSLIMAAARYSILNGMKESILSSIAYGYQRIQDQRNTLNVQASLGIAVASFIVATVSLVVAARS